jgi:hypothetical protein
VEARDQRSLTILTLVKKNYRALHFQRTFARKNPHLRNSLSIHNTTAILIQWPHSLQEVAVEVVIAEEEDHLEVEEAAEVMRAAVQEVQFASSNLSKLSLLHERKSVLQVLSTLHPEYSLGGYALVKPV